MGTPAYYLLHRESRAAMLRTKTSWGKPYHYSPRGNLLKRISRTLNISVEDAYHMLIKEREYLLKGNNPN
jgi:hypothetical protein